MARRSGTGTDNHSCQVIVLPIDVKHKIPSCAHSGQLSFMPYIRKGRKQMDESRMALHQHLGHSGRPPEIPVYLERRMTVPQILVGSVLEQVAKQGIGTVTVVQTRPLVQFPTHAPSRGTVSPVFQHHPCGLGQTGCRDGRDRMPRMQTEQMVHMTVRV